MILFARFVNSFVPLLVVAAQSTEDSETKEESLPRPTIWRLVVLDNGFEVYWLAVESERAILGYQVNVWELTVKPKYKWIVQNGTRILVNITLPVTNVMPEDLREPPTQPPVLSMETNRTMVFMSGVKPEVLYEVRVQAFTSRESGPFSEPAVFKIHKYY